MLTAQEVIVRLGLRPLTIEGGYFCETYRSPLTIPVDALPAECDYDGPRCVATAIYFLLTPDSFSALHRVKSNEIFHFYAGDAVEMLQLWPDGTGRVVTIGNDLAAGHMPQVAVPAGVWQRTLPGEAEALVSCVVSPGFDFDDFTLHDG